MLHSEPLIKPTYRRLFLLIIGLALLVFLIRIYDEISDLVVVIVISIVLSYVIRPAMVELERKGIQRLYSILGFFLLGFGVISITLRFLIPVLIIEIQSLIENLQRLDIDRYTADAARWAETRFPQLTTLFGLNPESLETLMASIQDLFTGFLGQSLGILAGTLNALTMLLVIPFITFFILRDSDKWMKNWIRNVPNRYFEMTLSLIHKVDLRLGNYIRSILLESLIVGLISWAAFQVMGLKFALILGVVCGLLNMIPFFGPLLAYFPVLLVVLLTYTPISVGLFWAVFILVIVQVIDNIVLKPFLISRSVNVHPAAVLLAVLIGGRLAGALGMFIAVPVYAIIQTLVVDLYTHLKDYRVI